MPQATSEIRVTLPDGSVRRVPSGTTVREIAAAIGPGLAKAAVVGRIDDALVDLATPLHEDLDLVLLTNRDPEALHVLRALDIEQHLDVIVSREDVQKPKPDPEIYLLVASKLDVPPGECLVLEDSVMGVRSGVAAGMSGIAVATPFTECSLQRELPVPDEWIVRESDSLPSVVRRRIEAHNRVAHPDSAGA